MKLTFPPGMSMAMVRDLPAEWEIWASLPGIAIATEDIGESKRATSSTTAFGMKNSTVVWSGCGAGPAGIAYCTCNSRAVCAMNTYSLAKLSHSTRFHQGP
eukprot:3911981-Amphidinium_carterae.2